MPKTRKDVQPGHIEQIRAERPSSYRGPNKTILDAARDLAVDVLDSLLNGEINEEYGYGEECQSARRITLAGGGPAADLLLVGGEAFIIWYEGGAPGVVMLPQGYHDDLVKALAEPWRDDAEDDDDEEGG